MPAKTIDEYTPTAKFQQTQPIINVGFNNFVLTSKIIAIIDSDLNSVKHLVDESEQVIDCTSNRARQSVVVLVGRVVVLSCIPRTQLQKRIMDPWIDPTLSKKRIRKYHAKTKTNVTTE